MNVSYSRDAFHTYMVIEGSSEQGIEETEKMLANQHSFALLPFHEQQLNEEKKYYYDISGRIELKSYVEQQPVGESTVKQLITFILELYRTMEEYLLDPDGILLDAAFLYVDMTENTLAAACIPGRKENFNTQLKQLAAWLLERADHTDREGVLLVYDFYKCVQRTDFLPVHLQKFVKKKEKLPESQENVFSENVIEEKPVIKPESFAKQPEKVKKEKRIETATSTSDKKELGKGVTAAAAGGLVFIAAAYKTGLIGRALEYTGLAIPTEYAAGIMAALLAVVGIITYFAVSSTKKRPAKKTDSSDQHNVYQFRDDTVENSYFAEERTVVLSGTEGSVRLISMNKHIASDLILSEFPCTIGSAREKNQYCVSVEGISRQHAALERKTDGIYIMDLNSTNGTKVNGEFLEANEKVRLMAEDVIELASVKFMYCQ